jgi:DNA-binding NtrC family response regulator
VTDHASFLKKVLIVDDEENLLKVLEETLKREGFEVAAYSDPKIILEVGSSDPIDLSQIDVVLTDLTMPGGSGFELLDYLREMRPDLPVILMTAFGSVEKAVEAMRRGAFDFITKPFDSQAVVQLLRKAANVLREQRREPRASVFGDPWAVARIAEPGSPMSEVLAQVQKCATTNAPLFISGESGTGKEALAREIHRLSSKVQGPFVKLHCGALSERLLEVELYGQEDGEGVSRPGRIELADGGTLLLEGITELGPQLQEGLLQFLKLGTFRRVGGLKTRRSSARVIAALDLNLKRKGGRLIPDLTQALSDGHGVIRVPPLRERKVDIRRLALFFLRQATIRANRIVQGISQDLVAALEVQQWPGNLRQLENFMESLVLVSSGGELRLQDARPLLSDADTRGEAQPVRSFKEQVKARTQQVERQLIEAELVRQSGNISRTAEALGLSRKGLQLKLKELGIRPD